MNGSPPPEQVEQWIVNSNHPSDHNARRSAVRALQNWTSNSPAHTFPLLFQLLQHSSHLQVRFYALTILGSHAHVKDAEAPQNRSHLRTYMMQQPPRDEPTFLRNKKAQILAAHMIHDGGSLAWPTVDVDLTQLASINPLLFLHTMIAVLEEFQNVSKIQDTCVVVRSDPLVSVAATKTTVEQTRRLKDVLKGYHRNENEATTSPTLLEILFTLVVQLLESAATEEVARVALQAIAAFLQWTDVSFFGRANRRCFDLMLAAILQTSTMSVQIAAVRGFIEYTSHHAGDSAAPVSSPIDDTNLLSRLLEHIHASQQLPYPKQPGKKSTEAADVDGETMELVIAMASVVNNAGLLLLLDTANTASTAALWPQVLDLFLRCFAYDDIDVTTAVLPLAVRLVPLLATHQQQQLPLLLNTLYEQMKYPIDFDYDFTDDENAEEEVFRTELCKVYEILVQTAPVTCMQFLCEAVNAQFVAVEAASTPTPEAEATLRLVYRYCEGVRPKPGVQHLLKNETFRSLLLTLHKSTISQHPHGHVLCLYFETAVRYAAVFSKEDTVLLPIFTALTTHGLQHAEAHVRSRCCYLLLRFVKATVQLLSPLAVTALEGIQAFLHRYMQHLRVEDILFLYESMGMLIGKTRQTAADQQRFLVAALSPLVASTEDRIAQVTSIRSVGACVEAELDAVFQSLAGSVAAIAYISKAFRRPCNEVREVFGGTLGIVLRVLEQGSSNEDLRNKVMIYLQRMIQCLDKAVLKPIERFLDILISTSDSEDILFVSQLLGSLCLSFGKDAFIIIDATLLPFFQRCEIFIVQITSSSTGQGEEAPHVATERMVIRKIVYSLLQHIVTNELSPVLISKRNAASFLPILKLVGQGGREQIDSTVKKVCVKIIRELLMQWVAQDGKCGDQHLHALLAFVCQSFVPDFLRLVLDKSFNRKDANNIRLVSEFCFLLHTLKSNATSNVMFRENMASVSRATPMPTATYEALLAVTANQKEMERSLLQSLVPTM